MRVYLKMMVLNLESQMQYKISFFMTVLGQFITAFAGLFSIKFIFDHVDKIYGFNYTDVILCYAIVVLSFSIGEAIGGGLARFGSILGNGEFDRALVRPGNVILQVLAPSVDFTRIGLLIQAVGTLAYAIGRSNIQWDYKKIITLALMIVCGSILFFSMFLFKATFAFFTVQDLDFLNLFTYGAKEFGKYPFSIYGKTVLSILTYIIPLAMFQYYPLLYLIGRKSEAYYIGFPLLSLIFLIPCCLFFKWGVRRYKSIGS